MTTTRPMGKASPNHIWPTFHFVVFFLMFYLYVWLWVDPSLLFHGVGTFLFPTFSRSPSFLMDLLLRPGGPVEYLSALLSQCYYYPWAGALIITTVAALLGLTTNTFMTAVVGARVPVVRFVPGILVLILCSHYSHQLSMLVALLVALLAVCVYVRTAHRSSAVRLAVFLALSGPLYYLAGGAYLLYPLLCAVFELRSKQGRLLGLCYLLFAEVIPCAVGTFVFDVPLVDACARLLALRQSIEATGELTVLSLYVFLLLAALGGTVWVRVADARKQRSPIGPEPMTQTAASSRGAQSPCGAPSTAKAKPSRTRMVLAGLRKLKSKRVFELGLVLVAAALAVLLSFDSSNRTLLRITGFAGQEMWPQVLQEAGRLRRDRHTPASMHAVTRALYETGELPYEMFSYPQHRVGFMLSWGRISKRVDRNIKRVVPLDIETVEIIESPSMLPFDWRPSYFFQLGDLSLELGMVNQAEHEARNALAIFGHHPLILKRLALINIVKGQTEAARVFLRALSGYMYYGDWAKDALRRLQADPLWSTDPQIRHIRSVMPVRESIATIQQPGFLLRSLQDEFDELLHSNRHNRMAFEYEMAFHLLNWRLDKLVEELERLDGFDYPDIPRHYQEAILIYESISGQKVALHGRQISPQTRQAYREFCQTLAPFFDVADRRGAWEALAQQFGDTYFFYYFFGASGVTPR